jgi:hypothetical protein
MPSRTNRRTSGGRTATEKPAEINPNSGSVLDRTSSGSGSTSGAPSSYIRHRDNSVFTTGNPSVGRNTTGRGGQTTSGSRPTTGEYVNSGGGVDFTGDPLQLLADIFDKQFAYLDEREELWAEYRGKAEDLLSKTPQYEIPQAISQMSNMLETISENVKGEYTAASEDVKSSLSKGISNALNTYARNVDSMLISTQHHGASGVGAYEDAYKVASQGFEKAITSLEGNIGKALDTYSKGADRISRVGEETAAGITGYGEQAIETYREGLGDYYTGLEKSTSTLLGDLNDQLNYAKQRAAVTELPGQSIYESKLGSQTQAGVRQLKELGGGSAGTLGAVSDLLAQQQAGMRNTAMQYAEYKSAQQDALQNVMASTAAQKYAATQQQAQLKQQGVANLAGLQTQQAQNVAQAGQINLAAQQVASESLGGAQMSAANQLYGGYAGQAGALGAYMQGIGGAQFNYANMLGDAYSNAATTLGGAQMRGAQTMAGGYIDAANLYGTGQQMAANYATQSALTRAAADEQQFLYNQYQPYQNRLNYYSGVSSQMDPFNAALGTMGDVAGIGLSQYQGQQIAQTNEQAGKQAFWGDLLQGLISGGATIGGAALLASSKDFKENITENEYNSLSVINGLSIKNYDYKEGYGIPDKRHVGVIAEEAPDVITTKDKKYVDNYTLTSLLIGAVQELSKEVERLKAE